MTESRCYADSPVLAEHQPFNRNGKALRGSKKSVLFYTTDCGDEKEDLGLKLQQRSVSLLFPLHYAASLRKRNREFHRKLDDDALAGLSAAVIIQRRLNSAHCSKQYDIGVES
ncbi:hypothetical protein HN011_006816 [Eciton burchellii]|nr:hypothetical protein HN011_006816 [Eciton burchellii]